MPKNPSEENGGNRSGWSRKSAKGTTVRFLNSRTRLERMWALLLTAEAFVPTSHSWSRGDSETVIHGSSGDGNTG